MALSGSLTTAESHGRSVTLNWSATQDIANNRSTISWNLKGSGSSGGWVRVSELRIKINGSQVYYRNSSNHTDAYNGTYLCGGDTTIYHSADGTKTFNVSIEAGIYQWAINVSRSANFTLNTIPRASTMSCSAVTAGSAATITVSRASASFTHTITYRYGNLSGTVCTKSSSTNISWTPPMNFCNQTPNSTSGTGTLVIDTYRGNTKVGSKSITFTCYVPSSVVPSCNMSVANTNNTFGCYAQNLSAVKVTPSASGSYGSTIKTITISVTDMSNKTATSGTAYTFGVFSRTGTKTIKVSVVDSRGRTNSRSTTINIIAYSKPSAKISASRGTGTTTSNFVASDIGNKAKVTATGSVYNISGNTITVSLQYRVNGTSAWTNLTATPSGLSLNSAQIINASDVNSYDIRLTITDKAKQSTTAMMTLSNGFATMDYKSGGDGVAFGMTATRAGLDVAMIMRILNSSYFQSDSAGGGGNAYWRYNSSGTQKQVARLYGSSDGFHIAASNGKGFLDGTWSGTLSDRRMKIDVEPVVENIIRAVGEVPFMQFRMSAEGYDHNELCVGIIAQDLKDSFEKHGVKDKLLMLDTRKFNPDSEDEYYCIEYTHFLIVRLLYDELRMKDFEDRLEKLEQQICK